MNALSASYSTQNEMLVATGYIMDADDTEAVNKAIYFIKILKHDTKKALNNSENGKYTIIPKNTPIYVGMVDTLNVRSGLDH